MKRFALILKIAGVILVVLLAGLGLAQGLVVAGKRSFSTQAMERFPGDRITALITMASCTNCSLEDRNHAVWALGEYGDRRGLEVLKGLKTGRTCDHAREVCQYEVDKAIGKIEGTWGLLASVRRK